MIITKYDYFDIVCSRLAQAGVQTHLEFDVIEKDFYDKGLSPTECVEAFK